AVQSARIGEMDMESAIRNYLKGGFVGIIQRLDQPVEGVLVFAKTSQAAAALNKQQQSGKMKKQYLAVFTGEPEGESGKLEDILLKEGRSNTSRVVKEGTAQGKRAVLFYKILKQARFLSIDKKTDEETEEGTTSEVSAGLVEVTLQTGRHHQIRVQMAYHHMPLWADGKYNPKLSPIEQGENLGLCAYKLEFDHPKTGKKIQFEIEPEGAIFKKLSAY
ncbi:MAG: RNA pseudouridine synthase, partial [Clostridia bacterium]|nr:RNA pseudouridine synthase [Clostridia bacterium]